MKQHLKRFLASFAMTALVSACGGGGGGGDTSPPPATPVTRTVSGTINQSSGATASKAAAGADLPVLISSYDAVGVLLSNGSVAAVTSSSGQFSARVPVMTGGYVLVNVAKDGYTDFHRRIDFTDTTDNVDMLGTVDKTTTAIQKVATYSNLSTVGLKAANQTFSFAVMRFPNGVKKAVANSAISVAKAAGAITELGLQIPADTLPGVSTLKADLNTYEPATDSAKFPGSYSADYNGQQGKMVSLAFDYIKITDADSGESLGKIAKKLVKAGVKKAAATNTVYTRWIPTSSCSTLFQYDDFDTTLAGRQVPVWTLNPNSGKWEFLGVGTIYDTDSATTPSASPTSAACTANGYYLKINISNETFLKSYWNLDHIVFPSASGPKKVCISGTITNGDSSIYLSMYGSGFDSGYTRAASDGKYILETVLLNEKVTNRSVTLSYTDNFGNYTSENVTLGDSPACTTKDITLDVPGTVTGTVKVDTGTAAYKAVQLRGAKTNRWVYADSDGVFTSKVKVGEDVNVYIGYNSNSYGTFRINGITTDFALEKSDTGSAVILNDISVTNQAPIGNGYLSSYSIKKGKSVTATVYASDEEGDYPIGYKLETGATLLTSGSITAANSSASFNWTPETEAIYPLTLTVTDSKGHARVSNLGSIEVSDGNRAPVVYVAADKTFVASGATGSDRDVTCSASGYDLDGDVLTYHWAVDTVTQSSATGKTFTYTIPATATDGQNFNITVTASDGSKSSNASCKAAYGAAGDVTVVIQ